MANVHGHKSPIELRADHETRHAILAVYFGLGIDTLWLVVSGCSKGRLILKQVTDAERAKTMLQRVAVAYAGVLGRPRYEPRIRYICDICWANKALNDFFPTDKKIKKQECVRMACEALQRPEVQSAFAKTAPLVKRAIETDCTTVDGTKLEAYITAAFNDFFVGQAG